MTDHFADDTEADLWSRWLLKGRHGGDPNYEPVIKEQLAEIRQRVLQGARLKSGMTLVDVGAGDGLISLGALQQVAQPFSVILADISAPILTHVEQLSEKLGLRQHCTFVRTSAELLDGIQDEVADVVTTRAVLAYVADKASAARNFLRVLKAGGTISIAEPINQDGAIHLAALTNVLRSQPANPTTAYATLLQRCRALQLPSNLDDIRANPLTNFSERDLLQIFRTAGFVDLHLELHIDVKSGPPMPWSTYIDIAPRPGAMSLREIFIQHFSLSETALFEAGLRPDVESGSFTHQTITAYLTAKKP